ncbi:MAG: MmgE/PrpD family protein [Caldisphaera sp.]
MVKTIEEKLARFAFDTTYTDIPLEVIQHAKLIIADTFAVIIKGFRTNYIKNLVYQLKSEARSYIISTSLRSVPTSAAFLNASAGTVLELDEGHRTAGSHMAVQSLPSIISTIQKDKDLTGKEFLTSFIIGYEIGTRVGYAVKPLRKGLHTHGTWGAVGAAVSAILNEPNLKLNWIVESIRISANMAHSTTWESAIKGATVRNIYAGLASSAGVLSATLAKTGLTGPKNALYNSLAVAVSSTSTLNKDPSFNLGKEYLILKNYFKRYPCCGYTHPIIEALYKLEFPKHKDINSIKQIEVYTFSEATKLNNVHPKNTLAAKFSVPFIIANIISRKGVGIKIFEKENIKSKDWLPFAKKVKLINSSKFEANFPDKWGAEVRILFNDGTELSSTCDNPQGDWMNPFSQEELFNKFFLLLQDILEEKYLRKLWSILNNLENINSIYELLDDIDQNVKDNYYK